MVTIQSLDNSLLFTFTNSNHYFQNGTVEVPKNSLALIVDDSDMASFKKSASNDLFISVSYTELGMSKAELISWFEENGFSEGGGGGLTPEEAQTMIDESISGKADSSAVTEEISVAVSGKADTSAMTTALADKLDVSTFTAYSASVDTALSNKADVSSLTAYFDGAEYNSTGKTIEFYNNGVLKDSIDATAFIKDGMVDTVSIEDITSGGTTVNCLVITFNTDSGKENINIPIKDIFDSDLYYTKTATDTLLDAKLNTSDFNTYSGNVQTAITAIEGDITNVQTALNGKVDVSAYTAYTSSTETTINGKASQTDLNALSGNVDTLSGQVADKADTTAMTTALADKLDISTFTAYSANVDTALQGKADASDLANYVETSAYTAYTSATDTALQGKADTSDLANYVETSAYTAYTSATDTVLNGKQATLVSGTNIKTINNTSLLGSGDIEISGGGDVDPNLDINSENAVANSAITKTIQDNELVIANALINLQNDVDGKADASSVNGKLDVSAFTAYSASVDTAIASKASQTDLNTVSAATASNTTSLNGLSLWKGTTAQYEAIVTKDNNTIYFVVD